MDNNPDTFKQLITSQHPDGVASDGRSYKDIPSQELTKMVVDKYPQGVTKTGVPYSKYLSSARPAWALSPDTKTGAQDVADAFSSGVQQTKEGYNQARNATNPVGLLEGGTKLAAGAVNTALSPLAPIFAPINEGVNWLSDKLSNLEGVQKFANSGAGKMTARVAEDVGNVSTIAGAVGGFDGAGPKVGEAIKAKAPDVFTKSVEQMRSEKIASGFEEQNSRLKSADKSFNNNTKAYKSADGTIRKVTPVDTFSKNNITPSIENGTINMGDYNQGTGALGKIKEKVGSLDTEIESKLKNSGVGVKIEDFKNQAIEQIKKDPTIKQSGKVASTISKLESVFKDYKESYGDKLHETEINAIRKVMNQDFHPDTMDVSHVIGDVARKIVYNVTKDQSVKTLLQQQGELLAAKKYAQVVHGTKVAGGKLGRMAMRTGGAIIGSTLHNLPVVGPLAGMLGGEYLGRALQQTQFKSAGAEAKALIQRSKTK